MDEEGFLVLEEETPFSQSVLWKWHQDFYLQSGVQAWEKNVPHYITSNPFIANSYAEIVLEFISEWVSKNPDSVQYPFYLLELGAGHGKFSFYFLKRIFELRARWPSGLKLCYVISDFSEKNIDFFSAHPNFKPYIAEGVLDFAQFNLEERNPIYLNLRQRNLESSDFKNPLIVCANYILDSIRKDSFYVDDRFKLTANLVNIKAHVNNMKDGVPLRLDEISIAFSSGSVGPGYYEEEAFNHILLEYNQQLSKQSFSLPTHAFRLVDYLAKLANGRLLFISSDKAHVSHEEFPAELTPRIAFHGGCFSLMTNFDALARYFKVQGGDAFIQSAYPGLATCVFASGLKFSELPRTELSLELFLNQFSPQDYFNFFNLIGGGRGHSDISLEFLSSYLKFSFYDPYIFNKAASKINVGILKECELLRSSLRAIVRRVAEQFYYMPSSEDIYFDVALFFHNLSEYKEALGYYEKSEQVFGTRFNTFYNLGLCHYYLDDFHKAESYFVKACELNFDSAAKDWLNHVRKKNGRRV